MKIENFRSKTQTPVTSEEQYWSFVNETRMNRLIQTQHAHVHVKGA